MKIKIIKMSKECTVQLEQFEPVTSSYSLEAEINEDDDVDKCRDIINDKLQKFIEFEVLKWKAPRRAITAGRKLGIYDEIPKFNKKQDVDPPF